MGMYVWLLLFVVQLFIHNPTDGYLLSYRINYYDFAKYGSVVSSNDRDSDCYGWYQTLGSGTASEKMKGVAHERLNQANCMGDRILPFDEWTSNAPLVEWFGSLVHFMFSTFLLSVLLVGWLVAFDGDSKNKLKNK
jgi:hypothetical protein